MSYLLNELLLYLLGAALLGALVGWLIRRCTCNRDLAALQTKIDDGESALQDVKRELADSKEQCMSYKVQRDEAQANYTNQSGDLMLMTSRWQTTLKKAKQLPIHQTWIRNLQAKYQQILIERNDFEKLACQYTDLHADANQKIKRLNRRVTEQEQYKFKLNHVTGIAAKLNKKVTNFESDKNSLNKMVKHLQKKWNHDRQVASRLPDMTSKVTRLNDKVTSAESSIRSLYGMVGQVQSKWRHDRVDTARLRELHPILEAKASSAQAELHAVKNKSQTEIAEIQKQRNKDLAEQNANNQSELQRMLKRINELTPLEAPSSDNKFGRFMDKVRLVGTSKNNVLGRTYKQINELKLETSQKERVFVDTCEEKDAVIEDLREQLRTAENRAQASSASAVQEYKGKLSSLEKELESSKRSESMLREHEHTIEALKNKFKEQQTVIPTLKDSKKTEKKVAKKEVKKEKAAKGLKTPAKGLNIAAATTKDDLKVVKGIGPVMEKTLNEFGVYSYEQLGRLKAKDINALAESLGSFPGRIERDKWVSQSKALYKKKYGKKID